MNRLTEPTILRILLVEDSKSEAVYIEKTLTQGAPNAYRFKKAQTVAQALELIEQHDFDVVLLDLGLPDAIGFSGLQAILNLAPKLPVVILTSSGDPEIEGSAMEQGAQDFLLKNMASVSALNRAMRNAIQRKHIENMKSEFVSVVSHELRTPLTSIHGALGLVAERLYEDVPEPVMRLIRIAYKNSERLIALVNDIVDIDKIDSGRMYFDIREERLDELIHQVVEANIGYGDRYNIRYVQEPVAQDLVVRVDASRLIQVLANFLSNAAKYSHPGHEVVISVDTRSTRVRVNVRDTGVGIKPEFQGHLFSKFTQEDSAITRKKGGAGLGLYISKQIIEHMEGEIGFTSKVGKGSTFWFELPLVANEALQDKALKEAQHDPRGENRQRLHS